MITKIRQSIQRVCTGFLLGALSFPAISTELMTTSARGFSGAGDDRLTINFVVREAGSTEFLVYAIAPDDLNTNTPIIDDPMITIIQRPSNNVLDSNNDWSNHASANYIEELLDIAGVDVDSRTAGLVIELEAGTYALQIEGASGETGIVEGGIVDLDVNIAANTGACDTAILEIELPMTNTGVISGAKGEARLRHRADCSQDFRVEIEDVPLGNYTLRVAGDNKGTITVVNTGTENEGEVEFDTDPDDPHELPMTFDPAGKLIEVLQGGTVILSLQFPSI